MFLAFNSHLTPLNVLAVTDSRSEEYPRYAFFNLTLEHTRGLLSIQLIFLRWLRVIQAHLHRRLVTRVH